MTPMRAGSSFHSAARARTVRMARRMSSAVFSMVYFEPGSRNKRYFSAKAVIPRLARYCAGSTPSGLNTSSRWPPPAATTTAVPFALPAGGRNTVSEGLWMFLYHQSLCCSGSSRRDSNPGAPFSHSGMTCWADAAPAKTSREGTRNRRSLDMAANHATTAAKSSAFARHHDVRPPALAGAIGDCAPVPRRHVGPGAPVVVHDLFADLECLRAPGRRE